MASWWSLWITEGRHTFKPGSSVPQSCGLTPQDPRVFVSIAQGYLWLPKPASPLPLCLGLFWHLVCLLVNFLLIHRGCAWVNSFGKSTLIPCPAFLAQRKTTLCEAQALQTCSLQHVPYNRLLSAHRLIVPTWLSAWHRAGASCCICKEMWETAEEDPEVVLPIPAPGRTCDFLLTNRL